MSTTLLRSARRTASLPSWLWLAFALAAGSALGWLVTPGEAAHQSAAADGPELARLLRGMALIKLSLVLGAALLLRWRVRFPLRPGFAAAYAAGLALIAAAPGLIWDLTHVALGAALFHTGLLALAVTAWRDPGSPAMLPARAARRR